MEIYKWLTDFGLCLNFSANSLIVKLKCFRKENRTDFIKDNNYECLYRNFLVVLYKFKKRNIVLKIGVLYY